MEAGELDADQATALLEQITALVYEAVEVLERAKKILVNLEESELTPEGNVRQPRRQQDREKLKQLAPPPQMDLFG